MRNQHPNDVLVEDGWHIVRNERPYDMYGKGDKKMIWYNVYHNHPGMGGMFTTKHILSLAGTPLASSRLYCTFCREDTPDVVDGFMNMIKWSEENAD